MSILVEIMNFSEFHFMFLISATSPHGTSYVTSARASQQNTFHVLRESGEKQSPEVCKHLWGTLVGFYIGYMWNFL